MLADQSKQRIVLHDASFRPRLRTERNPLGLTKGEWSAAANTRFTNQAIECRFGTSSALGGIVSAGNYRGHWCGRFQGTETIFVAIYVDGSDKTRVYMSQDGGATAEEITRQFSGGINQTGIGPYSTTRLDDDGYVWFALVQDRDIKVLSYPSASYHQDVIVFGNQSSFPRAYGDFYGGNTSALCTDTPPGTGAITNGSGTNQCAIIEPVATPTNVRDTAVVAKLCSSVFGFALRESANTNYINSGANYTMADGGVGATNNYAVLTIGTSAAVGDTAVLEETLAAKQLLQGKQLHIGVETANLAEFLAKNMIQVGNYAGSFTNAATIWNPTSQATECITTTIGTNIYLLSFDVEEFNTASTFDALRFTFLGGAPTASQTANIWYVCPGVAATGANPGGTDWAISHFNAGSHTESQGVVYSSTTYPARIEAPGGNEVPDSYTKYAVPASADLYFGYTIPIPNPTQAQANKGVEAARIYRKRPDDGDFFLVESYELAYYVETYVSCSPTVGPPANPAWLFTGSTVASQVRKVETLGREPLSRTTPAILVHEAMPKSRAGTGTSERTLISANVTGVPNFLVSAYQQPFRFSFDPVIDPDTGEVVPDSAGALAMPGDTIKAFEQVSGSAVGLVPSTAISVQAIYAIGEQYCYVTGGKTTEQLLSLSNMGIPGTISPMSVAKGRDTVFYLDREMQMRRIRGGSSQPLSLGVINNITKDILAANRPYVQGNYFGDRYYLVHRQSDWNGGVGGTNPKNKIIVWNDAIEDFESVDRPPRCIDALITYFDSATQKVKQLAIMQQIGASVTLNFHRYDNAEDTLDLGSNIDMSGSSFELHDELWNWFNLDRIGFVMTSVTGGTMTVSAAYKPNGGTRSKSVSIADASNSYVRRFDNVESADLTGAQEGGSAIVSFSASVPGGTKILEMHVELVPMDREFESPP